MYAGCLQMFVKVTIKTFRAILRIMETRYCCDCSRKVTERDKVQELYVCDECWEKWITSTRISQVNYSEFGTDWNNPFNLGADR